MLDGAKATVPNGWWRKAICDSQENLKLRNETARLRGGPHVRQSRGKISDWRPDLPRTAASSQAGKRRFRRGRSFADLRHRPCAGPLARRETHVLLRPDGRRD